MVGRCKFAHRSRPANVASWVIIAFPLVTLYIGNGPNEPRRRLLVKMSCLSRVARHAEAELRHVRRPILSNWLILVGKRLNNFTRLLACANWLFGAISDQPIALPTRFGNI